MTIQVKDLGSGVVSLKLDRPEKRNALNAELVASLTKSAHDLANNDDLRVVVTFLLCTNCRVEFNSTSTLRYGRMIEFISTHRTLNG